VQTALRTIGSKDKAAFIFASSSDAVQYTNIVPKAQVTSSFNAKTWSAPVAELLGGKSGGRDESTSGSGNLVAKVEEAVKLAQKLADEGLGRS
jgi:alanyl-tRNA synthetase